MNMVPEQDKNVAPDRRRFFGWPATRTGWWAVGLWVLFAVLSGINTLVFMRMDEQVGWRQTLLPVYGIFSIAIGLAAGMLGLLAVIRQRERSLLVWLPVLAGAFMLFLLLGEFLVPH